MSGYTRRSSIRPMERFRSAVAADMLSAAASISLRALSPCWLAILSILPATANWTLPNVPAAFRFTTAETKPIADIKTPARLCHYPTLGNVRYRRHSRFRSQHNLQKYYWTYPIGLQGLKATGQIPYTCLTRNCWISDEQVPTTPYVAFRGRHPQGMRAPDTISIERVWILGLTFGLC